MRRILAASVAALALAAPPAGAQVQALIYAPYIATLGSPPSPNAPFAAGSPTCTTTLLGDAHGFNLDFLATATLNSIATACGPAISSLYSGGQFHNFGIRFIGSLVAPAAGTYNLTFNSDDGYALTIDGNTIASNWNDQGGGPGSVMAALVAGSNPFILDYYENSFGGAFATLLLPNDLPAVPPTTPSAVPEPSTIVLTASGFLALVGVARRRRAA